MFLFLRQRRGGKDRPQRGDEMLYHVVGEKLQTEDVYKVHALDSCSCRAYYLSIIHVCN